MKAAIYARVSTEDQHLDNQLAELRRFAAQQGWTIVREYTDKATAKNGDRAGWKQMWKDVSAHRFDVLLFWSLDRLTREGVLKTHLYLKQLTDAGVKFKSYTEQYVDSLGIFGDAIIGLLAAVAQQERIRISDHQGGFSSRTQGRQGSRRTPPRHQHVSCAGATRRRRELTLGCAFALDQPWHAAEPDERGDRLAAQNRDSLDAAI